MLVQPLVVIVARWKARAMPGYWHLQLFCGHRVTIKSTDRPVEYRYPCERCPSFHLTAKDPRS